MGEELLKVIKLNIPCPISRQIHMETVSKLIVHQTVTCSFCRRPIDVSSKKWRTLINEYADDLRHLSIAVT
jgi:hypothetical protein